MYEPGISIAYWTVEGIEHSSSDNTFRGVLCYKGVTVFSFHGRLYDVVGDIINDSFWQAAYALIEDVLKGVPNTRRGVAWQGLGSPSGVYATIVSMLLEFRELVSGIKSAKFNAKRFTSGKGPLIAVYYSSPLFLGPTQGERLAVYYYDVRSDSEVLGKLLTDPERRTRPITAFLIDRVDTPVRQDWQLSTAGYISIYSAQGRLPAGWETT